MEDKKYPHVGIGVMIQNEQGQVLLGLRKGSHGSGEWCFPGGHLEMGEGFFTCAQRETKEETGLDVDEFELISVSNETRYLESDGEHFLVLGIKAVYRGGEPKLMEPNKFLEWGWFDLDNLPDKLFQGTDVMIENFKAGVMHNPKTC